MDGDGSIIRTTITEDPITGVDGGDPTGTVLLIAGRATIMEVTTMAIMVAME